jgi:hypothetical protein
MTSTVHANHPLPRCALEPLSPSTSRRATAFRLRTPAADRDRGRSRLASKRRRPRFPGILPRRIPRHAASPGAAFGLVPTLVWKRVAPLGSRPGRTPSKQQGVWKTATMSLPWGFGRDIAAGRRRLESTDVAVGTTRVLVRCFSPGRGIGKTRAATRRARRRLEEDDGPSNNDGNDSLEEASATRLAFQPVRVHPWKSPRPGPGRVWKGLPFQGSPLLGNRGRKIRPRWARPRRNSRDVFPASRRTAGTARAAWTCRTGPGPIFPRPPVQGGAVEMLPGAHAHQPPEPTPLTLVDGNPRDTSASSCWYS